MNLSSAQTEQDNESNDSKELDELIAKILPEVDEELNKNAEARHILNDEYSEQKELEITEITDVPDIPMPTLPTQMLNHNSLQWLSKQPSLPIYQQIDPTLVLANPFQNTQNNFIDNEYESPNHSESESENDPIEEIKDELNEIDEDHNGYIDFSEFSEVLESFDNNIIHSEIDAIYDFMSQNNSANNDGIDELNIAYFIHYLREKVSRTQNYTDLTAKEVIRLSFSNILKTRKRTNSDNAISTTNIWGVSSQNIENNSLNKLREVLKEESEGSESMDFEEFQTAMHTLGVMNVDLRKIFTYFISKQSVSIISKHLHKRKELNIPFFIKHVCAMLDGNEYELASLQPKQILNIAFSKILQSGEINKSHKGSHKNILDTNPYLDGKFLGGLQEQFGIEKIKKFESKHSVKANASVSAKQRELVRIESGLHWKASEFDTHEQEMREYMAQMKNGNGNRSAPVFSHNKLISELKLSKSAKMGIVSEFKETE